MQTRCFGYELINKFLGRKLTTNILYFAARGVETFKDFLRLSFCFCFLIFHKYSQALEL